MRILALCLAGALMAGTAVAQQQPWRPPAKTMSGSLGLYVFPTQNQNAQTQQADETACYAWSKENTGFDPLAAASAGSQASTQQPPKGAAAKGAARGAAAGAAIGAINGDAGQGAATGAVASAGPAGAGSRNSAPAACCIACLLRVRWSAAGPPSRRGEAGRSRCR